MVGSTFVLIEFIDGKKDMLSRPEVVMRAVSGTADPEKVLKLVALQHASPNTFLVQRYNTVFMYKTDKKKTKAYGAMYNVDTPKNTVENILHFFTVLQRRKIKTYATTFVSPELLELYRAVDKRITEKGYDSEMYIGTKNKEGKIRHIAVIQLGRDRLHKGA